MQTSQFGILVALIGALSAVFGAGVGWGIARTRDAQTRRDVNAIGGHMRRMHWNLVLALMVTLEQRDDRQRLADLVRLQ